ncbi:hypothetical protein ACVWZ6_003285 [Bradyrhizobium sp. GM6.1]
MIRHATRMLVLACCVCSQPAYSSLELQEVVPPLSFMLFCTQYPDDCQEQRDRRKTVFRSRGQRWRELNLIISTVNSGIAPESLSVSRNDYDWQIFPSCGFRGLRPEIPIERDHAFRSKAATCSDEGGRGVVAGMRSWVRFSSRRQDWRVGQLFSACCLL